MAEIEVPIDNYCSSYETMANEIREGIDEGFNEGLREGIKKGFVAGIRECVDKGFDNIEVKCMEEILKDALKTSSEETTRVRIRHTVGNKYRNTISPSFKQKMKEACDKAVEEIKKTDLELDKRPASGLKSCVNTYVKKIKECIGNSCGNMKKNFPTDLVFGSFFDGLQAEFDRDLDENIETCEKRIFKEIEYKTDSMKG